VKKIPTLFNRNWTGDRIYIVDAPNPVTSHGSSCGLQPEAEGIQRVRNR
jgi:hypothetical protein